VVVLVDSHATTNPAISAVKKGGGETGLKLSLCWAVQVAYSSQKQVLISGPLKPFVDHYLSRRKLLLQSSAIPRLYTFHLIQYANCVIKIFSLHLH